LPLLKDLLSAAGGSHGDEPTSASPYQQATEGIRAAARWLLTAFAAIGGVLVAGVPLTDVGRVGIWSLRFWVVIAAIVVALAAIGWMIRAVSRVFTAEYVSFGDLRQADFPTKTRRREKVLSRTTPRPPNSQLPTSQPEEEERRGTRRQRQIRAIQEIIDLSREELYGTQARNLGELAERLEEANEKVRSAGIEGRTQAEKTPDVRLRVAQPELERAASRVLDFANYEYTRRTFKSLFPGLALAGFIAAAGVVTYAVVVSSSPAKAPAITQPIRVLLTLKPGARTWSTILGPSCDIGSVAAVAVGGSLNSPEVVSNRTASCRAVRFRVGKRQGVAFPVIASSK
jgi:hypothetical protein